MFQFLAHLAYSGGGTIHDFDQEIKLYSDQLLETGPDKEAIFGLFTCTEMAEEVVADGFASSKIHTLQLEAITESFSKNCIC
jgi:hypothetical protein